MTKIVKTDLPVLSNDRIQVLENLGLAVKDIQAKLDSSNYYVDAQVILVYLTDITKSDEDPNVIPDRILEQANVQIEYIDGVPAVYGLPLWERLDCEPLDFYNLFKIYREQKTIGITKTDEEGNEGNVRYQRSFENLKETTGLTRKALYAISNVYHWIMRVSLYDSFRENVIEKEKKRLISLMENKHQNAASKIFEKCVKYFEDIDAKALKALPPKEVLNWFVEVTKLERLSRGLPGDKIAVERKGGDKTQTVSITNIDSKTLNLNAPAKDESKYTQKIVNILTEAGALPRDLEAKADVLEAVSTDEEVVVVDGDSDKKQIDTKKPE